MEILLPFFILLPLVGFLLSLLPHKKNEATISFICIITLAISVISIAGYTVWYMVASQLPVFFKGFALYETTDTHFTVDFFFDRTTAFYALTAAVITLMIILFSRYYMHRENGYKRFFNNILFFYTGLNCILFAGNFETLFIGWEVIGVASFLLIAFYRERYLPVKNALKVISVYRIADIFLLMGIWLSHHYFKTSITFFEMNDLQQHHQAVIGSNYFQLFIPALFLVVALVKSAQFPFSFWLPRAMEGPTTSSAVFYGSLSVHIGVFLLIRTSPFWFQSNIFKTIVIFMGFITIVTSTLIARVQSSVKVQIAYSSIAQIGIMFIEVAMGWYTLALIHFTGNAFLRTYQLLVSPSVLSYMIHDQFFNFVQPPQHFSGRLKKSIYILSIKEFNMDSFMYYFLWKPIKQIGLLTKRIQFFTAIIPLIVIYAVALFFVHHRALIAANMVSLLPLLCAVVALLTILRAFAVRTNAIKAWTWVIMSQLYTAMAIAFNEQFSFNQIYLFLSGILVSAIIGYACIYYLFKQGEAINMHSFQGNAFKHPLLAFVFLLSCLGLSGFPITPTFIGEDIILGHVHEKQYLLTILIALALIFDGLAIYRIYARLFLGPYFKGEHEVAYRSS